MAQTQHTPAPPSLEEAIITLFCEIDDAYRILNPRTDLYGAIKKLSDSEVLTLALFQQLRGVESERSFLRDVQSVSLSTSFRALPMASPICTPPRCTDG